MADPVPSELARASPGASLLADEPARAAKRRLPSAAVWLVARREMADLVTDWRIIGPAGLLIVVLPLLLVLMTVQGQRYLVRHPVDFAVESLVPFALMLVGFFPVSFSLMIA